MDFEHRMKQCPLQTPAKPDVGVLVNEVLGRLAYLIGEDEAPPGAVFTDWLRFEINHCGPTAGTLRCWCTRKFAHQLAANLLGVEPGPEEAAAAAEDACREFINVLCGQLVTAWYGTGAVFTLTIPTVCHGAHVRPPENLGEQDCRVYVAGEPLYCQYVADPPG